MKQKEKHYAVAYAIDGGGIGNCHITTGDAIRTYEDFEAVRAWIQENFSGGRTVIITYIMGLPI